MPEVNLEISALDAGILIKYVGDKASIRQSYHYENMKDRTRYLAYEMRNGGIFIHIEKNPSVEYADDRYRIEVYNLDTACALMKLLNLPGLECEKSDERWVVKFRAKFAYDGWYDAITRTPSPAIDRLLVVKGNESVKIGQEVSAGAHDNRG